MSESYISVRLAVLRLLATAFTLKEWSKLVGNYGNPAQGASGNLLQTMVIAGRNKV